MKKYLTLGGILLTVFVFSNCHSSKKAAGTAAAPEKPKFTYEANVRTVIAGYCSPCHIEGKGNKKPYDNMANAKADIDEMIRRIELNPGDRGFMPFKGKARLSDSTINVFKQWKADGLN